MARDAGRATGYVNGGISPFGQRRRLIELAPTALVRAAGAERARIARTAPESRAR